MKNREGAGEERSEGLLLALTTRPSHRREFLLALEEFRKRVLAEPGCVDCEILEDISHANRFVWSEWWPDRTQAERAVTENRFRALLGAVRLLGAIESLDWVTRRRDMAVVHKKRELRPAKGASL